MFMLSLQWSSNLYGKGSLLFKLSSFVPSKVVTAVRVTGFLLFRLICIRLVISFSPISFLEVPKEEERREKWKWKKELSTKEQTDLADVLSTKIKLLIFWSYFFWQCLTDNYELAALKGAKNFYYSRLWHDIIFAKRPFTFATIKPFEIWLDQHLEQTLLSSPYP